MATAEDLLEELLEKQLELVRARKGSERESQLEERIAGLEKRLEAKPDAEVEEAIEELDADEWELIRQHRAGKQPPPAAGDVGEEDEPEEKKPRMRRGRKHGQVYQDGKGEAGYVYHGEDEPDLVPVDDDEEATA
jgi:hypothetical protein